MKEIIYVQAGSLANYVGTHFWNTQQAYFTYDDTKEPDTIHDISFRQGLTDKGEETYCPRLLVFDRKANFGTLSQSNALFGPKQDATTDDNLALWNGDVVEYRQESIPKSAYQNQMDEELDEPSSTDTQMEEQDSVIRYWSDFNRVYYIPRTIQKLPDTADWEDTEGDWNLGRDSFARFNEAILDTVLMEESLRMFLEECDTIQGIHVMNDTATFGSFIDSFFASFRDEYLKLPSIVFPLLSEVIPGQIDVDDSRGTKKALNDALCLRGLNEMSSMNIPITSPATWSLDSCQNFVDFEQANLYHTSAVLSAHVENSTFPLRMKNSHDTVASLCAQLDWRGTTRFAQLNGIFPTSTPAALDTDIREFSAVLLEKGGTQFARRDVSRGFLDADVLSYDRWRTALPLPGAFISSVHAAAYPLPSSFPSFFKAPHLNVSRSRVGLLAQPRTASLFTSITTSSQTARLFSMYALFVGSCTSRKSAAAVGTGMDVDELRELGNDLWTLHDNFTDDQAEVDIDGDSMGEDEAL